jgi:hypothetical protein
MARDELERMPRPPSSGSSLPALLQLFGGYLHRDWSLDYESWEAAVDAFAAEATPEMRATAVAELHRLVDSATPEAVLDGLFRELDVNVSPETRGLTKRQWLASVLARLS